MAPVILVQDSSNATFSNLQFKVCDEHLSMQITRRSTYELVGIGFRLTESLNWVSLSPQYCLHVKASCRAVALTL